MEFVLVYHHPNLKFSRNSSFDWLGIVTTRSIRPSMTFSGALVCYKIHVSFFIIESSQSQTLTDLNDFITPSQACIKPVQQSNAEVTPNGLGTASVSRLDMHYFHHGFIHKLADRDSYRLQWRIFWGLCKPCGPKYIRGKEVRTSSNKLKWLFSV
jgi:hypothetical protein